MAAGSTYTPIATHTISSATNSYTFTSVPSTYTDLSVVIEGSLSGNDAVYMRFNNDSASNYGTTYMYGTGSGYSSGYVSSATGIFFSVHTDRGNTIIDIFSYANAVTRKTVLLTNNYLSNAVVSTVALWKTSNSPISSISFSSGNNFISGTTFSLFGIKEA
jgi:hypothetical protein